MKKSYLIRLITLCVFIPYGFTDDSLNSIAADANLYNTTDNTSDNTTDNQLNNSITIIKTFSNIDDVATSLRNTTNYMTRIASRTADSISPVKININNGKVVDFINQATQKMNYKWSLNNNLITFTAINPYIPKPVIIASPSKMKQESTIKVVAIPPKKVVQPIPTWTLSPSDRMLRTALSKWSKQAGWQLIWTVKADYPITTSWVLQGSFESAVNQVLQATQMQDTPLFANMYDANKVLEIRSSAN